MYSRSSRPRASVVRAWTSRSPSQLELARIGGEDALVGVERGREQLEAALVERDVVVQQQDERGRRRPRRPRCRGSRARGSRAVSTRAPSGSATSTLPSVEAPSTTITSAGAQRLRVEAREAVGQEPLALRSCRRRRRRQSSSSANASREQRRETRAGECSATTYAAAARGAWSRACPGRRAGRRSRSASSSARSRPRTAAAARARDQLLGPAARRRRRAGTPHASASATTIPKPSWSDGRTKSAAVAQLVGDRRRPRLPPRRRAERRRAGGWPTRRSRASGSCSADQRERARAAGRRSCADRRARPTKTTVGPLEPCQPLVVRLGAKALHVDRDRQDAHRLRLRPGRRRDRGARARARRVETRRAAEHLPLEPAEQRCVRAQREPRASGRPGAAPPIPRRATCRSSSVRPAGAQRAASP